jgi:hypothetical protein
MLFRISLSSQALNALDLVPGIRVIREESQITCQLVDPICEVLLLLIHLQLLLIEYGDLSAQILIVVE